MNAEALSRPVAVVTWRGLFVLLVLLALVSACAGAGAAYWLLLRYTLHVPLPEQPLTVILPDQMPVEVEVLPQDATTDLPDDVPLSVFPVRINDDFKTVVNVDTQVPIRMSVPFRGEVPVNITLPVRTQVKTRVLGIAMRLPIEGDIPLNFRIPVDLMIPIDQTLPMKFQLPVSTRINQVVNVKVSPVQSARIHLQNPALTVQVNQSELAVPLSWLSLVAPEEAGPLGRLGPLVEKPAQAE